MTTFQSIFPTFLDKCGELHDLLLNVAYALFIVGVIITAHRRSTRKVLLNLLARLLTLTALLVYLPVWGNTVQQIMQDSIISGLGVDPAQVYNQFFTLLVIKDDSTTLTSWWGILSNLPSVTVDLLITAALWLIGHLAALMMYWGYIFQKVILNMGYALSPLLIGFMAVPSLKHIGGRYLLNLVGVLIWPLGWAVAALVTQGILDFMTNPTLQYIDPTSQLPTLQRSLGAAAAGFWIIFSTIAAPVMIQKVISSGVLASEMFSHGVHTVVQTAAAAVGGAVAAAPFGPLAAIGAGGAAGALNMASTAGRVGSAGSLVSGSLSGLGSSKGDPSGSQAVRQMLTQVFDRLNQLPAIPPVNSLPPKL